LTAIRAEVYAALDSERAYQERKWEGVYNVPASWATFIASYAAEMQHQATRTDLNQPGAMVAFLNTLRKTTALGVACMEQHGAPKRFIPNS